MVVLRDLSGPKQVRDDVGHVSEVGSSSRSVRTFHNPKNLAIIAANRSLGFREADFDM